jgi:hypothetical protein
VSLESDAKLLSITLDDNSGTLIFERSLLNLVKLSEYDVGALVDMVIIKTQ